MIKFYKLFLTNYAPVVAVLVLVVLVVVVVVVLLLLLLLLLLLAVLSGLYTHCGIEMYSNVLSADVIIWGGLRVTGSARSYGV